MSDPVPITATIVVNGQTLVVNITLDLQELAVALAPYVLDAMPTP